MDIQDTREKEAILVIKILGYEKNNADFLNLPFYETSNKMKVREIMKKEEYLKSEKPTKVFICGDKDPNGTRKMF